MNSTEQTTSHRDERPYRLGVGVLLFNAAGLVFAGERLDTPGAWQFPQGGIDAGEDPLVAARRELEEETGVSSVTLLRESEVWLSYDLPGDLSRTIWRGRYRGQKQKWFAFRHMGDDSEINLQAQAQPEFSQWRWMPLSEMPASIVAFKRSLYDALVAEFIDLAEV